MNQEQKDVSEVWKGIGLVFVLHLLLLVKPMLYIFLMFIQFVYVIPLYIILSLMHRNKMAQGALIASGITFLLNTVYCGYVASHGPIFYLHQLERQKSTIHT